MKPMSLQQKEKFLKDMKDSGRSQAREFIKNVVAPMPEKGFSEEGEALRKELTIHGTQYYIANLAAQFVLVKMPCTYQEDPNFFDEVVAERFREFRNLIGQELAFETLKVKEIK